MVRHESPLNFHDRRFQRDLSLDFLFLVCLGPPTSRTDRQVLRHPKSRAARGPSQAGRLPALDSGPWVIQAPGPQSPGTRRGRGGEHGGKELGGGGGGGKGGELRHIEQNCDVKNAKNRLGVSDPGVPHKHLGVGFLRRTRSTLS